MFNGSIGAVNWCGETELDQCGGIVRGRLSRFDFCSVRFGSVDVSLVDVVRTLRLEMWWMGDSPVVARSILCEASI